LDSSHKCGFVTAAPASECAIGPSAVGRHRLPEKNLPEDAEFSRPTRLEARCACNLALSSTERRAFRTGKGVFSTDS